MTEKMNRYYYDFSYDYRVLDQTFDEEDLKKYQSRFMIRAQKISINWNQELNSEWNIRYYLAIKMIMASTLTYNSLEFSEQKNVLITKYYLEYYTLLCACRALIYTMPEIEWNEGKIKNLSHNKIISHISNALKSINQLEGEKFVKMLTIAKENRELFSYAFPSNGSHNQNIELETYEIQEMATLLLELAQFNSEMLEKSTYKNSPDINCEMLDEHISEAILYENDSNGKFIDLEDASRVYYIARGKGLPHNLCITIREGMVEDFLGAWSVDECSDDELFNPDKNFTVLFDLP